jgi:hypothetical protein
MSQRARSSLAPLTEKQRRECNAVVLAYADWWNHLKFKKGWEKPLFTFNEVCLNPSIRESNPSIRESSHVSR